MPGYAARDVKPGGDIFGLVVFLIVCLAVAGIGGAITATSVDTWYQVLNKPSFNPPDWIFAPVWTTLYILMAVAAWRVRRRARSHGERWPLTVFAVQLGLNLVWSLLFFGFRRIDLAMLEIVVLLVAITANAVLFWRIDRLAGLLFLPYGLWVAFATALNISIWLLN